MTNGYSTPIGVPIGLPSILSLGLPPLINPFPTLNLDFIENPQFDSRITFTRASDATYFNSLGVLTTASSGVARFDYNPSTLAPLGLLIEEQRTNSIRNNTMQGAVAGTPGTLPTNWSTFTSLTGLTREIVGTGTENGITYIDIKLSGTPSASGDFQIFTESTTQVVAASGQSWTNSVYYKLQSGSMTGVSDFQLAVVERNAAGAFLAGTYTTQATPNSTTQRGNTVRTLSNASTARVSGDIRIALTGVAIDITLRIGLPQLEQGAFATSVIPTTTTALTRNADVASMTGTNFSSWYNQNQGTFLTIYSLARPSSGSNQFTCRASDNGYNNAVAMNNTSTGFAQIATASGGVFDGAASAISGLAANVVVKFAGCYATNDLAVSLNGAAVVTDTSATIPTNLIRFDIGSDHAGVNRIQGGHLQRIAYYPTRLPNGTLQALTA